MTAAAISGYADPWRYQPHPEVWLLVASLVGLYIYVIRSVGPKAVPAGQPIVTRGQIACFTGGIALLWFASDWPVHDIGEQYLYSVHMFQHLVLSYFMPPLMLLATPEWFFRLLIGRGKVYRGLRFLTKPVVAGIIFNGVVMVTHIPGVVNTSTSSRFGALHYSLHFVLVMTALLMWMPVCGPFRELRIGPAAQSIYLFLQSVVPTVPAGWLTMADGVVYKHYDIAVRVWGVSVTNDQQIAGAIMKIGGGFYLWTIVIYLFFKRFAGRFNAEQTYKRGDQVPTAEITGNDLDPLTYADVTAAFETTPAPSEPMSPTSGE